MSKDSIRSEIDGTIVANAIALERQVNDKVFMVVEGSSDLSAFEKLVDLSECEIQQAYCREHVLEAVRLLDEREIGKILGIVDRDYWGFIEIPNLSPNIVVTCENDLEMTMLSTALFRHVLREFGSDQKCAKLEGDTGESVYQNLVVSAAKIGLLRLYSHEQSACFRFADMRIKFDGSGFCVNLSEQVRHVLHRSGKYSDNLAEEVVNYVEYIMGTENDLQRYCSGHDLVRIMARALRTAIGSCSKFDSEGGVKMFEKVLRLGFSKELFQTTSLYRNIVRWQQSQGVAIV